MVGQYLWRLSAVLEAPAFVSGFDDVAVMRETIEKRGCHLRIAEDARPFAEGQIGGDDDGSALVEPTDEVEEKLAAGLCKREIAKFVEDDEVHAGEMPGFGSVLSPQMRPEKR
jgi:hypothetical protein